MCVVLLPQFGRRDPLIILSGMCVVLLPQFGRRDPLIILSGMCVVLLPQFGRRDPLIILSGMCVVLLPQFGRRDPHYPLWDVHVHKNVIPYNYYLALLIFDFSMSVFVKISECSL